MVRLLGLAAILGAACAAAIVYLAVPPAWRGALTASPAPLASADLAFADDDWSICTTAPSLDGETEGAPFDADLAAGQRALAAGEWTAAIAALERVAQREPANADIQHHLGHAYLVVRQPERALAHFQQAVALDPQHRAAHRHLGEIYLAAGDADAAADHLAALDRACPNACTERVHLHRAIAAYEADLAR